MSLCRRYRTTSIFDKFRSISLIDITPASHRPCAEIFKTVSDEPIMQSIIDRFSQTDDWLWKSSRFSEVVSRSVGSIWERSITAKKLYKFVFKTVVD